MKSATTDISQKKTKGMSLKRKEALTGYLFIAPALISLCVL